MAQLLPLSNNTNFSSNYLTYVNMYNLDKTTYLYGFSYTLNNTGNGEGIKGKLINSNTIQFSPFITANTGFFNYNGSQYVPAYWAKCNMYQQKDNNLIGQFTFQGNFNTNTLHTAYGDNYSYKAFILAFNSDYSSTLSSSFSTININGNFSVSMDTTNLPGIAHLQWGFEMDGYPVYLTEQNNQGSVNINDPIVTPIVCFKEDTKILTDKGYLPIQNLRKGDLIQTLNNGYKPIDMIGKRDISHQAIVERIKDQLYKYSQTEYPEVFEDLVITGCHSILVEDFVNEEQKEKAIETLGQLYLTDNKYRLPACADLQASVYENPGTYTIYHLALEHDDYYMNYGIYANGLLVETCSKRYLKELSNMKLIE